MIVEAFSAGGSHGLAELMGYVLIVALFGWICRKSFSAFRAKPNSSGFSHIAMEPRKHLDEGIQFKIKMAVCLVAIVAGLVMVVSGDKDLLEAGIPLALLGLIFAFGFSHSHKKWMKQERETRERNQAQVALQTSINRVSAMTALPVVNPISVILRPGKICHYQESASVLQVKNEVVGHTSGSAGVSVRVAKGLTLHSGGSRDYAIRQAVSHLHPGLFTIMNQRFIMTGEKGFDHPLSKLTAMTPYNGYEGITLQFGRSVYTVIMDEPYIVPKIWDLLQLKQ